MSERYLECISGSELERLQSQHEAWLPETLSLLKDAGFPSCRRIAEFGCGPGFTSLEIARSLNRQASITAVDVSDYYLNHLRQQSEVHKLTHLRVVSADLMNPISNLGEHDAAFCRWFLAWVTRGLDQVLENINKSLRVGGVFACMEYLTLRSTCHSPPCSGLPEYIRSWEDFYLDCGGTTELGCSLPQALLRNGFEIIEVRSVGGYAEKGHRLFAWWKRLYEDFHQRFLEKGLLSSQGIDSLNEYWKASEITPGAFIYTPILLQVIAKRKE